MPGKHGELIHYIRLALAMVGIMALAAAFSLVLNQAGIGKENLILVFLVGVLLVTVLTKQYLYGVIGSVLSILIFNFFFTQPVHTLRIYSSNDILLLLFFLIASLITSSLTSKFQRQAALAQQKERSVKQLYEMTEMFFNVTGLEHIVIQALTYIQQCTGRFCSIFLYKNLQTYWPEPWPSQLREEQREGVDLDWKELEITGILQPIGVMKISLDGRPLGEEEENFINSVVSQMILVLDREYIVHERENIRIAMEREHFKSNLLRSISHDLRTPLTGIVGASGFILSQLKTMEKHEIGELTEGIYEQALWLAKLVENILNMTRIDEGKLVVRKNREVVDDVVNEAITHVTGLISERRLNVIMPDRLVAVPMDGKLIVQVLVNLLDNAVKYTQEEGEINLSVILERDQVSFQVSDDGKGIDQEIFDSIFESFVTSSGNTADANSGVGLGLAVSRSIIHAHGGTMTAQNRKEGGASFQFTLPLEEDSYDPDQ